MASNCSWVFKALFFGFACCVQEKGATVLVRGWEGGFDSAKRWSLCMLPSLSAVSSSVFSWRAPPAAQCASLGLGTELGMRSKTQSCVAVKLHLSQQGTSPCTRMYSCPPPAPADLIARNVHFSTLLTAALQKWQSCWMGLHHFSCFRKCLAGCIWQPVLVLGHGEWGNCFGVPGQHGTPTMAVTLPQVHCA